MGGNSQVIDTVLGYKGSNIVRSCAESRTKMTLMGIKLKTSWVRLDVKAKRLASTPLISKFPARASTLREFLSQMTWSIFD